MNQYCISGRTCPSTTSPFESLYEDEMRDGLARLDAMENRGAALDAVAALFETLLDLPNKRAVAALVAGAGARQ